MPSLPLGKDNISDTDGFIDPDYQEDLRLLRQRGQRGAYPEPEAITMASLGASMPCEKGEQIIGTIIAWQGQHS